MQFVDTFNEILALSLPLLMVFVLRIDLFAYFISLYLLYIFSFCFTAIL